MIGDLNLYNLVCGIGNQLRYVDRFSTCRRNHKENVAEHQFFTAFFTLMICAHLGNRTVNGSDALVRALVHDIEEHCTGDVIRPVKHGSKNAQEALESAGQAFCKKFFESLTKNVPVATSLYATWKDAKDNTNEGRVVKFADFLSVLAYLNQEVRSGNLLVMENVSQLKAYCENFQGKEFDFVRPLVSDAFRLVEELDSAVKSRRRS